MKKIIVLLFTLCVMAVPIFANDKIQPRIHVAQDVLIQEDVVTFNSGAVVIENQKYEDIYYQNGYRVDGKSCEILRLDSDMQLGIQRVRCTYSIKTW